MEKAITTALFVIASIAAAMALINGLLPAVGRSSSALTQANANIAKQIKTQHDVVFVTGSTTTDVITAWVKNVGVETIDNIDESDVFVILPDNTAKRVEWESDATCSATHAGGGECWEYALTDGATRWTQGVTLQVRIRLQALAAGPYTLRFTVKNGVGAEEIFSI